jgi:hypothetical protein
MGEFNVDKTTGGLNPTAGMPDTYPATQVMMSDGVTSVEEAVDELAESYTLKWSGEKYATNETITIPNFDSTKKYLFVFRTFTVSGFVGNFVVLGNQTKVQITFFGDSTQFCRYRFKKSSESSNVYTIDADSANTAANNALIEIYEIS